MSAERSTVVVAVDESESARAALRWAGAQANLAGAPRKVVHAFQPHHLAGVFGIAKLQPDAEWRADAQQWLMEIVKEESATSPMSSSKHTSRPTDRPPLSSPPPPGRR